MVERRGVLSCIFLQNRRQTARPDRRGCRPGEGSMVMGCLVWVTLIDMCAIRSDFVYNRDPHTPVSHTIGPMAFPSVQTGRKPWRAPESMQGSFVTPPPRRKRSTSPPNGQPGNSDTLNMPELHFADVCGRRRQPSPDTYFGTA